MSQHQPPVGKEEPPKTPLVRESWKFPWEDLHKKDPLPMLAGVRH